MDNVSLIIKCNYFNVAVVSISLWSLSPLTECRNWVSRCTGHEIFLIVRALSRRGDGLPTCLDADFRGEAISKFSRINEKEIRISHSRNPK